MVADIVPSTLCVLTVLIIIIAYGEEPLFWPFYRCKNLKDSLAKEFAKYRSAGKRKNWDLQIPEPYL